MADSKKDIAKAKAAYLKGQPHRLKLERESSKWAAQQRKKYSK